MRLHVAVDQTLLVNGVQRTGDLPQQAESARLVESLDAGQFLGEVGSVNKAGDEKEVPAVVARRVDRYDMGMLDGDCGFDFALEALPGFLVFKQVRCEDLDRDWAVERAVYAFVDDAHPSAPEHAFKAVVLKLLAEEGVGGHREDRTERRRRFRTLRSRSPTRSKPSTRATAAIKTSSDASPLASMSLTKATSIS